ncbi:MAG: hypothetical protein EBX95_09535, partial [Acidimicrobiia bacterium]|nr:hypothetical protein [Acidimicrobiia bacterium]
GTVVFTAVNGGTTVTCNATSNGVKVATCQFTTLASGTWTVTAVHTDGAGNSSSASDPYTLVIDTTAPSAPTAVDLLAEYDYGTSNTDNTTSAYYPRFTATRPESTGTMTLKLTQSSTVVSTCWYYQDSTDQFCSLEPTNPNTTGTIAGTFTDLAGNVSASSTSLTVTFDRTAPTLTTGTLASIYGGNQTVNATSSESGRIYATNVRVYSWTDITALSATQARWVTATGSVQTSIGFAGLDDNLYSALYAVDAAGNPSSPSASFQVKTSSPTVTRVYGTNGAYKAGAVVDITVEFSEAVTVTGTGTNAPRLNLSINQFATYVSGSGTNSLVFRFTMVSNWSNTTDLNYNSISALDLGSAGGGTIKDAYGNSAIRTLPALTAAESLASQSDIVLDTAAPTVTVTSPATPTNATDVNYTYTFNEPVTGLTASNFTRTGTATGCSFIVGVISDVAYRVTVAGCSEGTVTPSLTANTVSDAAGNAGPASAAAGAAVTIDRTAPAVTACTCGPASGVMGSSGATVTMTSNSAGTGYLLNSTVDFGRINTVADINAVADNLWNQKTSLPFNTATAVDTLGLIEGTYNFFAADQAGNLSLLYTGGTVTIDNTPPTFTSSSGTVGPGTAKPSATSSEVGTVRYVLSTYSLPSPVTATSINNAASKNFAITISSANTLTTWPNSFTTCCTFTSGSYDAYAFDAAGNPSAAIRNALTLDVTMASVINITSPAANGTYLYGSVIPIDVTFNEVMTASQAAPPNASYIVVAAGGTTRLAYYASGSGTDTLRFNYTVQAGDTSSDLDISVGSPSVYLSKVNSADGSYSTFTSTVTFNVAVSGFDASDITRTGTATGCSTSVSSTSSTVYVITFSGCSDGTIVGSINASSMTGPNTSAGPTSSYSLGTMTKDTTAPVVTPGGVTTFGPSRTTTFTVNGAATVYLVSTSVQVTDVNSITSAPSNQRATFVYTAGTTTVTGSGLLDGDYKYYAVDSYGNLSAASTGTFTYDTVAPTITLTPGSLIIGGSASMSSNEVASLYLVRQTVTVTNSTSITGAASTNAKGVYATNKSTSLAVSGLASDRFYAYAIDNANNVSAQSVDYVTIDNTAPAVTSVTASADGTYIIGQTVLIDVVFDDTVTVNTTNGTPTLLLETGTTDRNASYVSGSGTTTLRFSYTVQDGDLSTDLSYVSTSSLSANGGTMTDVNGNTATLALPTIGFPASLQARSAVVVRGQRITASAVYSPATNPTNAASVSYAFSFSSAPTGLESSDFTFGGTATGCIATVSGAVTSSASVIVSGCSDGTVILKLPAGSMSDSYGNTAPGTEYSAPSLTVDRTGPVPTFTAPSTPTSLATLAYTVAFNETMSGLIASDFQVTGTALGCVVGT